MHAVRARVAPEQQLVERILVLLGTSHEERLEDHAVARERDAQGDRVLPFAAQLRGPPTLSDELVRDVGLLEEAFDHFGRRGHAASDAVGGARAAE